MFPDSDAGSGDEWIDIADTQSVTSTEHVTSDEIDDNLESEAEGYETDSEDNDIHSENSADELEEHTTESSESDNEIHDSDICENPQFTEDRKRNSTAASCTDCDGLNKRFPASSGDTRTTCRKKYKKSSKHGEGGGERGEDKMSKDELAQLLKQRKERAAIIGQTRVCGESVYVYECDVCFGGRGGRVSWGMCREFLFCVWYV